MNKHASSFEKPNTVIQDYVRRKIRRGFDKLLLPKLAQRLVEEHNATLAADTSINNQTTLPASIWETFDKLSEAMPASDIVRSEHLHPYIDVLQDALNDNKRIVFHAPPQCSKTFSSLVALTYFCMTHTGFKHVYITYNETRANDVLHDFIYLLKELGVKYTKRHNTVHVHSLVSGEKKKSFRKERTNSADNIVKFTSIHGSLTGYSVRGLVLLDDVIKGEEASTSKRQLDHSWNFFLKELRTRESKEFSVICMMTRWSVDDLSGKLIKDLNYEYIRIPALCDDPETDPLKRKLGESIWPERRSTEQLKQIKRDVGERIFESMYQGNPRPDSQKIFETAKTYDVNGLRRALEDDKTNNMGKTSWVSVYGLDLSYGGRIKSDTSVCVHLRANTKTKQVFVERVLRKQCLYQEFLKHVEVFWKESPGTMLWFTGGQEEFTAGLEFKRTFKGYFQTKPAIKSKYIRAVESGIIKAWNNKEDDNSDNGQQTLMVPEFHQRDDFMTAFVENVEAFSTQGATGYSDDDVDAVVAAYTLLKPLLLSGSRKYGLNYTAPYVSSVQKELKRTSSNRRTLVDKSVSKRRTEGV